MHALGQAGREGTWKQNISIEGGRDEGGGRNWRVGLGLRGGWAGE